MNVDLAKLQKIRFRILQYFYQKSEADIRHYIDWEILLEDLAKIDPELNATEIKKAYTYLVGEGLVEGKTIGFVGITHYGIKEYENAMQHPEEQTTYFPPFNVLYVEHMEHSQIQQGTIQSSQIVNISNDVKHDIEIFIDILNKRLEELGLEKRDETEIKADISTIEAQINSSRPKTSILKESLSSIKRILEGAAGSIVAHGLLQYIPTILDKLG